MSIFLMLPDGNAISPSTIKSVQLSPKGVVCRDAQQRLVAWIPVTDDKKGKQVRDLMIKAGEHGARAAQPDWSFLNDETVAR